MSTFHPLLVCDIIRLQYDWDERYGEAYFPDGHCCDMTGCIQMFQAIDPLVRQIQTYSGTKEDMNYFYDHDAWLASRRLR